MLLASFGGGWLGASYKQGVDAQRLTDTETAIGQMKSDLKELKSDSKVYVLKEDWKDERDTLRNQLNRIEKKLDELPAGRR
jgi:hypothetical protein